VFADLKLRQLRKVVMVTLLLLLLKKNYLKLSTKCLILDVPVHGIGQQAVEPVTRTINRPTNFASSHVTARVVDGLTGRPIHQPTNQ